SRIHVIGICGRLTSGLALSLREEGVTVTGSDVGAFGAIPQHLAKSGIHVSNRWSARNLPPLAEAVIIGALVMRGNAEIEAALARELPVWNAASFIGQHFLQRSENFVVAGTKGKTTTTAMLAWIFQGAERAPDYLVGGSISGWPQNIRLRRSPIAVVEGDEYQCGLGDPAPKFLRYHPRHVIITNIEHDHPDIYPDLYSCVRAFGHLIDLIPCDGSLLLNADHPRTLARRHFAHCRVRTVGFSSESDLRLTRFRQSTRGIAFHLGGTPFTLALPGRMNALNAALAAAAAQIAGVSLKKSAALLATFPGVTGRQQLLAQSGHTFIYEDNAYVPHAVAAVIEALRGRHPAQRIVFVFEPRSTGGRRQTLQRDLPEALAGADVLLALPSSDRMFSDEAFDHRRLCRDARRHGIFARACDTDDLLIRAITKLCRADDVLVLSLSMDRESLQKKITGAVRVLVASVPPSR
ncbi:MAG: Mur ligase family protein, partial [Verrucomicrobiaceae bacterium]